MMISLMEKNSVNEDDTNCTLCLLISGTVILLFIKVQENPYYYYKCIYVYHIKFWLRKTL